MNDPFGPYNRRGFRVEPPPIIAQQAFDVLEKYHKITYDDSEQSRISVAHRVAAVCAHHLVWRETDSVKTCHDLVTDPFLAQCKKGSSYSKDACKDILNNAIWFACETVKNKLKDCSKYKYKAISSIDTSAGWLWGIGGLLIGGIVAAMVWVLVYCVFLRKKGSKVSKGPSVVQGK